MRIRRQEPRVAAKGIDAAPAPSAEQDFQSYLERLHKMIPGEVIGLYLIGQGLIPADQALGMAIWAVVCLVGVVVVRAYGTGDAREGVPPDWKHVFVSVVAFAIWVYTLGGPFELWGIAVPYIGSLLVLGWTFFAPFIYRGPSS